MNCISETTPPGNKCPGLIDMARIANYRSFNYGACTGFWKIYIFCINVNNWSYISCSTNQTLGKSRWWTTTPHKMATGTKTSVSNINVLFFPCVFSKATAHVDTKALNMRHQLQNDFRGIFVAIPRHQKGYLIYIPSTQKIVSSHDVVLGKNCSSALEYTSYLYWEALKTQPEVSYIPYATSSHEKTGDIIIFAHFEEGNLA